MFGLNVKAPEFQRLRGWINSEPLKMQELKGKVVLIDFWAYTCINCLRTLPYVKRWHEKYSREGLVVIGIHSPEFGFEKEITNVRKAVENLGIKYPVAVDSEMKMWNEYNNRYWPAKYIVDRDGFVAYAHFGEGEENRTERVIQQHLGVMKKPEKEGQKDYMFDQSPETYAGFTRNEGLGSGLVCDRDDCNIYVDNDTHELNTIYPDGRWEQESEYLELKKAPGRLAYRFNAREVNMVMAPVGDSDVTADIFIDGKKKSRIRMDEAKLYNVFRDRKYAERELAVVFNGPVRVFVYTFG